MKKRSLFLVMFTFVMALALSFFVPKTAYAENVPNDGFTPVDSLSDLVIDENNNISGNYKLESDINVNEQGLDWSFGEYTFSGELDGNGFAMYGSFTNSLFKIVTGKIHSLSISKVQEILPLLSVSQYLTAELNMGFIANEISGGVVTNVKIDSAKIENAETHELTSNSYIGFLAGKVSNGATIKNCVIQNCITDLKIAETQSSNFSFGAISGIIENSTMSNNIINLRNIDQNEIIPSIIFSSNYEKSLNIGGLVGVSSYGQTLIYNNVVLLETENISLTNTLESSNIGSMIGNMMLEQYLTNIDGFISTNLEFFGARAGNVYNYSNLKVISYSEFSSSIFFDASLWNDVDKYKWDFDNIWMNVSGSKLPVLQCYNSFDISFDKEESKKSLTILGELPKYDVVSYKINEEESAQVCDYGNDIYISVNINDMISVGDSEVYTNYDKYFYISALLLDGKLVYNNETNTSADKYSNISVEEILIPDEDGVFRLTSVTYKISQVHANNKGVYSVVLGRKLFKINVVVNEVIGLNGDKLIPGKFIIGNKSSQQSIIDLKYGDSFVISTNEVNSDYSNKAYWFVYDNMKEDVLGNKIEFSPVENNANYYGNRFEFTFDEDCFLFNVPDYAPTATIYDVNNYKEVDGVPNYQLVVFYTTKVKQVQIIFKDNNDNLLKMSNDDVILLINDSGDRLVYNDEEGIFEAKVAFDKSVGENLIPTTYILKLDQLDKKYNFIGWEFEIGALPIVDGDEFVGSFDVNEATEEPLIIYCVLKTNKNASVTNLLWLWITIGVVCIAAIIIVIIIVVKHKNGGSSYKKYYY